MIQDSYLGSDIQSDYTPTSDERNLAILSHILTVVASIFAPLIIYLLKKDESKYVSFHAKESLNFQITMMIIIIGLFITIIGILVAWIVGIAALVFVIIATIKASEGKLYKYPFSIRLIK
ncbi:MAG: DUF4870 domain-containing protein [Segetibacter sp.]